ncbi:MAG: hypothetical protein LBV80_04725 [Deltaproteobacteria bacterium]|jgi:hypothetical protein|nr:hypothetical protein [Deltaproteobacteria bacterium]
MREIDDFLKSWDEDSLEVKAVFSELYDFLRGALEKKQNLSLDWKARPNVSYSLRLLAGKATAEGATATGQACIAMLDIIDDDPEDRWLSLYLDAELAKDPDGRGDLAPRALDGRDALCFDIDENDEDIVAYLTQVLEQTILKAKI